MPFAQYQHFDECVNDQKARGHNDLSAHKICGYLEAKAKGTYHKGRKSKKKK